MIVRVDSASPSRTQGLTCSACGYVNPSWHTTCERCQARLVRPEDSYPATDERPRRPGCLIAWVMIFGSYTLVTGFLTLFDVVSVGAFGPADGVFMLLIAAAQVLSLGIVIGVWQRRPWARIPAIGLHFVLIALLIVSLVQSPGVDPATAETAEDEFRASADVFGTAFWLALNGVYIWWLATRREVFEPRTK
jgi:hypothetical protein